MEAAERRAKALAALGVSKERRKRSGKRLPKKEWKPAFTKRKAYFTCASKNRYRSEGDATYYANRAFTKRGVRLRAYYCANCGGWHLTKQVTKLGMQDER